MFCAHDNSLHALAIGISVPASGCKLINMKKMYKVLDAACIFELNSTELKQKLDSPQLQFLHNTTHYVAVPLFILKMVI